MINVKYVANLVMTDCLSVVYFNMAEVKRFSPCRLTTIMFCEWLVFQCVLDYECDKLKDRT